MSRDAFKLDVKRLHKNFGRKHVWGSGRTVDAIVDVVQSAELVPGNYVLVRRNPNPRYHLMLFDDIVSQVSFLDIKYIDERSREVIFDNGSVIKLLTEMELDRKPNWLFGRTVIKVVIDPS